MLTSLKKIVSLYLVLVLFGAISAMGQGQMQDLSVDELYEQARTAAFDDDDYDLARKYAYEALDRSPDYHGIRIFVARLYSWEGRYIKAREELQYVLKKDAGNQQAWLALIDVEKWSGNESIAMQHVQEALGYHPDDIDLMLQKAAIFYNLGNYEESESTYKTILSQSPSNFKARRGLEDAQLMQMKYRATVSYRYDRFRTIFDPWHFTEFGLTRQTPIGSVKGRIEYAQRFGSDGAQFNVDAYPSITEGLYAYVSGGYSQSSIYPDYRFGFSLYKSLPSAFEVEAGIRYLDFGISQTDIYTVSLTKYLGSYLFTARTYLVPSSSGTSKSINLVARRYFSTAEAYFSLNMGYGSAPTEIEFSGDVAALDSWSLSIDGQYPISETWFIGGNTGFDSSEYPNFTRERFSTKLFVSYRF